MKLSWKWLHDFLPEKISPERVAEILTAVGLEVEGMQEYHGLGNGLHSCVVAQVESIRPHPNAKRLCIVGVNFGADVFDEVICGAPNIACGNKVILAKVGAQLTTYSGQTLKIEKRVIAGIESSGMLCSESELGLSADGSGIMILPDDAILGMAAGDYFQVYQDVIFTISITPNRVDAMSHYAVAREILAYENYHNKQKRQLNIPSFDRPLPNSATQMEIKIMCPEFCARYTGIGVKNIQIKPSPKWMQDRLRALGMRCINNIVDLTNYVLLAYGNPVHAYDMEQISGRKMLIRNANIGESVVLLNNTEYRLGVEDIVIADSEDKALCLAGVMGGLTSGINAETRMVFFEVAHFNSKIIKQTTLRHKINSEASQYFSKGTDVESTLQIMKSLLYWLMELCPQAQIEGSFLDIVTHNWEPKRIRIQYSFVEELSGKHYTREQMRKILMGLGFEVLNESKEEMELKVPLHKNDIRDNYDIVEEVMRLDGLDEIPVAQNYTYKVFDEFEKDGFWEWLQESLDYLSALGWNEIMTNTIVDKANYGYTDSKTWVALENPLSAYHNILRPDTLYSGLEAIAFNWKRQSRQARFFEFAKQYRQDLGQYYEQELLSLWSAGLMAPLSWHAQPSLVDIYHLKGTIEALFSRWRITEYLMKVAAANNNLVSTYTYEFQGQIIATCGEVLREHCEHFSLEEPVYFATLPLRKIYSLLSNTYPAYKPISAFPAISRDLSLIVPLGYTYSELVQELGKLEIPELQHITLFDRFQDPKWRDRHSLTLRFIFQSSYGTFTEGEIKQIMQRIIDCIQSKTPASVREK